MKNRMIIQDDFFDKETYNNILADISRLKFTNRHATVLNKNNYQKRYFNVPLNINHFAVVEVLKKLKDYDLDLKMEESNYFLSTKHEEPSPHQDSVDVNCLIYLKGLHILNSGTGFYEKKDDDYVLNRHIGFKENRAVIFDAQIFHTSLQFNDVTGTRYIMANFLTYKK